MSICRQWSHKAIISGIAVCAYLGIFATGRGATDISVLVSRQYIEQGTALVLADKAKELGLDLAWTATARRQDDATVRVHADGRLAGGGAIVVTIDFDIVFGCGSTAPANATIKSCDPQSYISIDIRSFIVNTIAGPLPDDQRRQIEQQLRDNAGNISTTITCALNDGFKWANTNAVCPRIIVNSDGDITAELDFIQGWITGNTKTQNCVAPDYGTGKKYTCENGRWKLISGNCIRGVNCRGLCCDPLPNGACRPGKCAPIGGACP